MVISDEVQFVFGSKPFIPMGVFGETVPVVTLGGISKRWMVPGYRFGWIAVTDPKGVLRKNNVFESIVTYRGITADPAAPIQGAIPQIIAITDKSFFAKAIGLMRGAAELCYRKLQDIDCITCSHKPEGAMSVMVSTKSISRSPFLAFNYLHLSKRW
ncbi:nicotianamine aminotransferase 1-like [Panicum virgatum]|uniref:nicotianamine aminotransferase 1-like n=1 Tax=Panicum virgatum TaxID=38727 RepID=UPI0019D52CCA|nr:nicotianamine aminotransferase 1-like [Panicum virgatum]